MFLHSISKFQFLLMPCICWFFLDILCILVQVFCNNLFGFLLDNLKIHHALYIYIYTLSIRIHISNIHQILPFCFLLFFLFLYLLLLLLPHRYFSFLAILLFLDLFLLLLHYFLL